MSSSFEAGKANARWFREQADEKIRAEVRAEYQPLVDAAERVLSGARTGLNNESIVALYHAVKGFRK